MEERKTAAIVLSIVALVIIFYTAILPEIRFRGTQTISFKSCKVNFKYFDKGLISDIDRAANNKLALCLCDIYAHKPDTAVARKILNIYNQYGTRDSLSVHHKDSLNSIISDKKTVFDTLILID